MTLLARLHLPATPGSPEYRDKASLPTDCREWGATPVFSHDEVWLVAQRQQRFDSAPALLAVALTRWFARNLIGNVDGCAPKVLEAGDILRLVCDVRSSAPVDAACHLPRCRRRDARRVRLRGFHRCRRTLGMMRFFRCGWRLKICTALRWETAPRMAGRAVSVVFQIRGTGAVIISDSHLTGTVGGLQLCCNRVVRIVGKRTPGWRIVLYRNHGVIGTARFRPDENISEFCTTARQ